MSDTQGTGLEAHVSATLGALTIDAALAVESGPLVIVGPNGSGKTSLLLLLLGVLRPARGHVRLGADTLFDAGLGVSTPVETRRIGYVPQDFALFPHLTACGNIELALRGQARTLAKGPRRDRAMSLLQGLGIEHLAARLPGQLSGGEQQRVALARALATEPRALLLDEPMAALDVHTRQVVRAFVAEWLKDIAIPTIIVSHDPNDARLLGAEVAVLEAGRIVQRGPWDALVAAPATPFVAALVSGSADKGG